MRDIRTIRSSSSISSIHSIHSSHSIHSIHSSRNSRNIRSERKRRFSCQLQRSHCDDCQWVARTLRTVCVNKPVFHGLLSR